MKTYINLAMIGILSLMSTQAQAQTQAAKPVTVSDQITATHDYVSSITGTIEALGKLSSQGSKDYEEQSAILRGEISNRLKKFEKDVRDQVLNPMSAMIDAYNFAVEQKNENADIQKLLISSKRQLLDSIVASYQQMYHSAISDLYMINPSFILLSANVTCRHPNRAMNYRSVDLEMADGTSLKHFYDLLNLNNQSDKGNWSDSVVREQAFFLSFAFKEGNTNPVAVVSWDDDQSTHVDISAEKVLNRSLSHDFEATDFGRPNHDDSVMGLFYPEYVYQNLRGKCSTQFCITQLLADYQEYFLEVSKLLDRDLVMTLVDGKTITIQNSKVSLKRAYYNLIMPSLSTVSYPDEFRSLPFSN